MKQLYEKQMEICQKNIAACNIPIILLGTIKVLSFFAIPLTYFIAYSKDFKLAITTAIALVFLLIFLIASKHQERYKLKEKTNQGLVNIHNMNLQRLDGSWNTFTDTGSEYVSYEHAYATDLDIVGKTSLFQMINSTHTYFGRKQLASDLLNPTYTIPEIEIRQQAIQEISDAYVENANVEYACSNVEHDVLFETLLQDIKEETSYFKHVSSYKALLVLRICTIIICFIAAFTHTNYIVLLCALLLTLQLFIWLANHKKATSYTNLVKEVSSSLQAYVPMIQEIINMPYQASRLLEIQQELVRSKQAVRKLAAIASNVNQSQNALANFILNLFWLWDMKNANDLDLWKKQYSQHIDNCFSYIGEYETYLSFANLKRNVSKTCLPTLTKHTQVIQAIQIGHPLLTNASRVCNDFDLHDEIMIISGSNMSGKTTFLRTVGINMVLAKAGSFVVANKMTCPLVNIISSMRIADDLHAGISTFYAELQRIKKIIDLGHVDPYTCFFIDEIFRGTNSVDRLYGAKAVLKQLNQDKVIGFMTTHDLDVCTYEDTYPRIVNYSFNETYKNDEMYFDYKLRTGISKSTNAKFLLHKVGIIQTSE